MNINFFKMMAMLTVCLYTTTVYGADHYMGIGYNSIWQAPVVYTGVKIIDHYNTDGYVELKYVQNNATIGKVYVVGKSTMLRYLEKTKINSDSNILFGVGLNRIDGKIYVSDGKVVFYTDKLDLSVGVEHRLTKNISLRVEYINNVLGSKNVIKNYESASITLSLNY